MYYVDREGVKIKETMQIIEMGTEEWAKYKEWCAEGNEPEFGPPYVDETIVSYPLLEMTIKEHQKFTVQSADPVEHSS